MSGEKVRCVIGVVCLLMVRCTPPGTGTPSAPATATIASSSPTDIHEPGQAATLNPTLTLAPTSTPPHPAFQFQCGNDIQEIAYSPDGAMLAALGKQRITICDMSTLSLRVTLETESEITGGIDWSPQGTRLVAGLATGQVRIWDTATWQEVITYQASDTNAEGWDVAWSPDGYRLLTTGVEAGTHIWHASTGDELLSTENSSPYSTVSWSPDSKHFVMSNSGGWKVLVKDSATGQSELQFATYYPAGICTTAWSPDGTRFVVGYSTGEVTMFDAGTAEILLSWHPHEVSWASDLCSGYYNPTWSPDGKWLASVSSPNDGPSNIIYMWDAFTGQELAATGSFDGAISLGWSPDGKYLAGGMENGAIYMWEPHRLAHSPDPLPEVSLTEKGPWYVFMAAIMPKSDPYLWAINADGSGLTKLSHEPLLMNFAVRPAAAGESDTLIAYVAQPTRLSEAHTLKIVTVPGAEVKASVSLGASGEYNTYTGWGGIAGGGLVWSQDGSKLAFASARNTSGTDIWLYDANTEAITRITAGKDNAHPLSWSPDGRYLIFERFTHLTMGRPDGMEIWSVRTDGTGEVPLMRQPGASFLGWRESTEGLFEHWDKQLEYWVIEVVHIETGESQTIVSERHGRAVFAGEYNALLMMPGEPEAPLILIRNGERIEIPDKQIDWTWWDSSLDLFVGQAWNRKYFISPLGQYVDRPQPEDFLPAEWSEGRADVFISPDETLWAWWYWYYHKDAGTTTQLWVGEPMAEPAIKLSSSLICDSPDGMTWSPDSQSLVCSGNTGLWIARRPGFEFTQVAKHLYVKRECECDSISAWVP